MIFSALNRFAGLIYALSTYRQQICRFFGLDLATLNSYYKELDTSGFLIEVGAGFTARRGIFDLSMMMRLRAPTIYALCRIMKPDFVIETGVADGFSTSFILKAMETNRRGKLYSIDLPNQSGQELAQGKSTGWIIPPRLKNRWDIIIGSSEKHLAGLLEKLGQVDIFYHDSDHSYRNMTFEFSVAKPHIRPGGLIISDDITDNCAFSDFSKTVCAENMRLFKLGVLRINEK